MTHAASPAHSVTETRHRGGSSRPGERTMATFMDVHEGFVGVTAEQLQAAHDADLAIEAEEGVHFVQAWLDPESGKAFCLSTGPSKEAIMRDPRASRPPHGRGLRGPRHRLTVPAIGRRHANRRVAPTSHQTRPSSTRGIGPDLQRIEPAARRPGKPRSEDLRIALDQRPVASGRSDAPRPSSRWRPDPSEPTA